MNEMVVREAKTVLKNTFRQLRKEGWFARMNFKCCQSCGWSEVPDDKENVVFYHNQDNDDLNRRGEVYLAHSGKTERLVDLLKENSIGTGLVVDWNGSDSSRVRFGKEVAL